MEVQLSASGRTIEFKKDPQSPLVRAFICALSLFPFWGVYDILFGRHWNSYLNLVFLFACLLALGAALVGSLFLFFGLCAMNQFAIFDGERKELRYGWETGVTRYRETSYPISELEWVKPEVEEWSEGPPSHYVSFKLRGQKKTTLRVTSAEEAQKFADIINELCIRT